MQNRGADHGSRMPARIEFRPAAEMDLLTRSGSRRSELHGQKLCRRSPVNKPRQSKRSGRCGHGVPYPQESETTKNWHRPEPASKLRHKTGEFLLGEFTCSLLADCPAAAN